MTCRIVDADDGTLLLAKQNGGGGDVYRVSTRGIEPTLDGASTALMDVDYEEGALVEITHSGDVMETFPAQLDVLAIDIRSDGFDDLCELYLDVLDDLWEVDKGLNNDLAELGVDLSATRLPASEQAAVAIAFGGEHGIFPVQGTYDELAEQGYITGEPLEGTDAKFWHWEDGCLFSVREKPMEGVYSLAPVTFDAQKWRSGTGAYYFADCTAIQSAAGEWGEYTVGSQAIS